MRVSLTGPKLPLLAIALATAVCVFLGWRLFWFETDDAYIAFRYVGNHFLGRGFTWNPPPFRPVEGYTSFLWVVLLRGVWGATGWTPPEVANGMALLFGYATLLVGARIVWEMPLPARLVRLRPALLAFVLLGTVTNRTFLAWLSSGLETSLFNFCLTLWIWLALRAGGAGRTAALATAATLCAWARPDGMLVVLGTGLLVLWDAGRRSASWAGRAAGLLPALPLLGVPAHLVWRRLTYGAWLPNTYYAKYTAPWPESGLRYAACFVLEYAWWIWLAVALGWVVRRRRLGLRPALVVAVLVGHFLYYTISIGGDHFEYRVYSHLVLLLFASLVWLLARLDLRPAAVFGILGAQILLSWPVPWLHWLETHELDSRAETYKMARPIAHRFPPGLRWYAEAFDTTQHWLIMRSVGMRHQEHKIFFLFSKRTMVPRRVGQRLREGHPVTTYDSVGVLGWVYPHVAIIDSWGLNDFVVARSPVLRHADGRTPRQMAHDRKPPPGYVDCLRPNGHIEWEPDGGYPIALKTPVDRLGRPPARPTPTAPKMLVYLLPREEPLTAEDIVRCENEYWGRLGSPP